jgi:hypothetical protein
MSVLTDAIQVIKINEGRYCSVNPNDNGALSIGCMQWHGERAKRLLRKIVKVDPQSETMLPETLYKEILGHGSWGKRCLTDIEKAILTVFLGRVYSTTTQDCQIVDDATAYLKVIAKQGVDNEDAQVFLMDIYNQSPASCLRIIKNTHGFEEHADLDNYMKVALSDTVMSRYKERRFKVYKMLTGKVYNSGEKSLVYTVVRGDTLSRIARKYNTSVLKIARDNHVKNINAISIGEKLTIFPNEL